MSGDRELLEQAAKAAGLTIDRYSECGLYIYTGTLGKWWSPLMDDGDALRLAVKLGLLAEVHMVEEFIRALYQDDQLAWTRRAVVSAAAEIGRGMA